MAWKDVEPAGRWIDRPECWCPGMERSRGKNVCTVCRTEVRDGRSACDTCASRALWSVLERAVCFQEFSGIAALGSAAPFPGVTTTYGRPKERTRESCGSFGQRTSHAQLGVYFSTKLRGN